MSSTTQTQTSHPAIVSPFDNALKKLPLDANFIVKLDSPVLDKIFDQNKNSRKRRRMGRVFTREEIVHYIRDRIPLTQDEFKSRHKLSKNKTPLKNSIKGLNLAQRNQTHHNAFQFDPEVKHEWLCYMAVPRFSGILTKNIAQNFIDEHLSSDNNKISDNYQRLRLLQGDEQDEQQLGMQPHDIFKNVTFTCIPGLLRLYSDELTFIPLESINAAVFAILLASISRMGRMVTRKRSQLKKQLTELKENLNKKQGNAKQSQNKNEDEDEDEDDSLSEKDIEQSIKQIEGEISVFDATLAVTADHYKHMKQLMDQPLPCPCFEIEANHLLFVNQEESDQKDKDNKQQQTQQSHSEITDKHKLTSAVDLLQSIMFQNGYWTWRIRKMQQVDQKRKSERDKRKGIWRLERENKKQIRKQKIQNNQIKGKKKKVLKWYKKEYNKDQLDKDQNSNELKSVNEKRQENTHKDAYAQSEQQSEQEQDKDQQQQHEDENQIQLPGKLDDNYESQVQGAKQRMYALSLMLGRICNTNVSFSSHLDVEYSEDVDEGSSEDSSDMKEELDQQDQQKDNKQLTLQFNSLNDDDDDQYDQTEQQTTDTKTQTSLQKSKMGYFSPKQTKQIKQHLSPDERSQTLRHKRNFGSESPQYKYNSKSGTLRAISKKFKQDSKEIELRMESEQ
ncbi:MAG: hypothetical protein EZS28_013151 [Streblomastix strix]|uniref:Uncharacterized protein n=1 Tax=Streblomastix strix TaxID=222440 RepID=A0A5J4W8T5_9EUKA|nr:MAG: hypothetical protein EZS28_013151 [Streblomastix strix]